MKVGGGSNSVGLGQFLAVNRLCIILLGLCLQQQYHQRLSSFSTTKTIIFSTADAVDVCEASSSSTTERTVVEEEVAMEAAIVMPPKSAKSWIRAQKLEPPIVSATESGEAEGAEWWLQHEKLFQQAWNEWTEAEATSNKLPKLNDTLIDPALRSLVTKAWNDPTTELEDEIRSLWDETMPSTSSTTATTTTTASTTATPLDFNDRNGDSTANVLAYKQFLTEEGLEAVRIHLDALTGSGIPLRRPNAMNRYGMMLDPSVPGGVGSTTPLMIFLKELVDDYVRPLGRAFFPSLIGQDDDARFYAFSIRYSSKEDVELKEHSDASVVTLNLNLNLPYEDFSGSSIYFVPPKTIAKGSVSSNVTMPSSSTKTTSPDRQEIQFGPGMALLHRGMTRHAALPIEGGSRQNLVIWLYGRDGSVRIAPYEDHEQLTIEERWWKRRGTELEDEQQQEQRQRPLPKTTKHRSRKNKVRSWLEDKFFGVRKAFSRHSPSSTATS